MKTIMLLPILLIVTTFLGCSSVRVNQDYDVTADFSTLSTYAWQSEKQQKIGDPRMDNPLLDARIRKAVEKILAGKGFLQVVDRRPDFWVVYHYDVRSRIGSVEPRTSFGFGLGSRGGFGGVGISTGSGVREYDEAALVIDVLAGRNQALLWRGTGTRPAFSETSPEKMSSSVFDTVDRVLAGFPPDGR